MQPIQQSTMVKTKNTIVLTVLLLLLTVTPCLADSVELGFNDVTGILRYSHAISSTADSNADVNLRFLRNTERDTTLGSAGFEVRAYLPGADGLQLGGGIKSYLASYHDADIACGAMGVLLDFFPYALGGFGISGNIYYGPEVFTGKDANRLLETNARLAYRFATIAEFFVAYNNIRIDLEHVSGHATINESTCIGMVFYF